MKKFYPNAESFLQLLFESLYAPYGTSYAYRGVSWEIQYRYARESNLLALTLPSIKRLAKTEEIEIDLLTRWEQGAKEEQDFSMNQQKALLEFLQKAEQAHLPFTVFKGCILADLYPDSTMRYSKDTDLLISIEDTSLFYHFLENMGYLQEEGKSKEQVPVFVRPKPYHKIELHYSLWEEYNGPKIQQMNTLHITDPSTFVSCQALGHKVQTLGYTEHLFYLIFHICKHVVTEADTFGGLVDLTLFVNHYKDNIDFPRLWKWLEQLGYSYFAELLFNCSIRYLRMDSIAMEGRSTPSYEDVGCLITEFIRACTLKLTPHYNRLLYAVMTLFVDGSDANYNISEQLEKHKDEYEPIQERLEEKLKFVHTFRLTSKEYSLGIKEPISPKKLPEVDLTKAKKQASYLYTAYNLTIASDIEMKELFPITDSSFQKEMADIYIHCSPEPNYLMNPGTQKITSDYIWFEVECGRLVCRNGNETIVETNNEPNQMQEMRHYIVSHAMCFLMYMRGILPLHSSSVGNDEGSITLLGNCGAGKSTYSSLLRKRGYKLMADDVSAISIKDGTPYVRLSIPQQKYTEDSARQEGLSLEELECVDEGRGKYRLYLSKDDMCDQPKPATAMFELIPDYEKNELRIEKIEGLDALRLLSNYHFSQYLSNHNDGLSVEIFQTMVTLAKQCSIYRIYRPTNRDAREEVMELILKHSSK